VLAKKTKNTARMGQRRCAHAEDYGEGKSGKARIAKSLKRTTAATAAKAASLGVSLSMR
jgi:hypothetical protein